MWLYELNCIELISANKSSMVTRKNLTGHAV